MGQRRLLGLALAICAPVASHAQSVRSSVLEYPADVISLASLGVSGGLSVPDGRALPDGTVVFGYSRSHEPVFSHLRPGNNYLFGVGLLPYVELSGRLANYSQPNGRLGVRDLSANLKIEVPKIFEWQPHVAFGINDVGGGAPFFRSKYVVASGGRGAFDFTLGYARSGEVRSPPEAGDLDGIFGGVQFALWSNGRSGVVALAERKSDAIHYGLRYVYSGAPWLGAARVAVSAHHSARAVAPDGRAFNRPGISLNLVIPLARQAGKPVAAEPVWTPPVRPPGPVSSALSQSARLPVLSAPPLVEKASSAVPRSGSATDMTTGAALPEISSGVDREDWAAQLASRLKDHGFERLRLGRQIDQLVIEFENHRFNWDEADALGLALGLAIRGAPPEFKRVTIVTKKAGLPMFALGVDRDAYESFVRSGAVDEEGLDLTFVRAPSLALVEWFDTREGSRGWSRVRIEPSLVKFVATELGVFDYSLAANVQAFVPLWRGAELSTSYLSAATESRDVAEGFLGWAQQRKGLRSATVSQAFWLGPNALTVFTGGRMQYDHVGLQNETTVFLPGAESQVRLQYSRVRFNEGELTGRVRQYGAVSYSATYRPLDLNLEAGFQRYRGMDRGPFVQLSRWFGDVEAQVFMRKSNIETRVGFGLVIPLTPRVGMRPGIAQIEGSNAYPFRLETKYARPGQCNCITQGVVEEVPMIYSARQLMLNRGRFSREYFVSRLLRMRAAYYSFNNK